MAEELFAPSDPRAPSQQIHLTAEGLLAIGSTGRCLSAAPPSTKSVFGRKLESGWAVQLINWGSKPQQVTCGGACMAKMGWAAGESVAVRDLWAHTENGTVADELSFVVPGGGASVLVKVSR